MPASEATTIEAGGRDLRVTSPDRVIFPETERTGAVTKLDIVIASSAVDGQWHKVPEVPGATFGHGSGV